MVENPQPDSPGARPLAAVFEYSRPAFHAIQEMVLNGYRKFRNGGEEEAGVLYGTREGTIVRVEVARRIECEHTRGRTLLLSASDTVALKEQLTREASERDLQGLKVVGWFLSHASPLRTAMRASRRTVLSSADLQTFDEYFGTPGQVMLVLRPHISATMQASVFVRRADGTINVEKSDLDFPFREPGAFSDRPKIVDSKHPHPSAPAVHEKALAAAATMAATVSIPTARQTIARPPATSPSPAAASAAPTAPPEPTAPALAPAAAFPADPVAPARKDTFTAASPAQPRIPQPEPNADPSKSGKPAAPVKPPATFAAVGGCDTFLVSRVAALDLKPYPNFGSYSDPAPRFTFEFAQFLEGPWSIVGLVLLAGLALMPLGASYYRSLVLGRQLPGAGDSQNPSGTTTLAAPPPPTLPVEVVAQQSTRTEQQKPAGWVSTQEPAPAAQADQPAVGQIYLQIAAVPKSRCAVIVDALRNSGFPAVISEVPHKPGLYRVLVGPLRQGDVDKTRANLQGRGFLGDSAIKQVF